VPQIDSNESDMNDHEFAINKVCYEQNCLQMRSLNQIMWQVPMIAMTLTGGLWFGVNSAVSLAEEVRDTLFIFCGVADFLMILIIQRVRSVMDAYLDKIRAFSEENYPDTSKKKAGFLAERGVCNTFSLLLLFASALSFIAICKV